MTIKRRSERDRETGSASCRTPSSLVSPLSQGSPFLDAFCSLAPSIRISMVSMMMSWEI